MKHSVQAWGVHLWWSLKVDLQDLHPPTGNTIYGPETLHVQCLILFTTFPNIVHHPERSKAVNQLFWHWFSEGNLAELAIDVMCLACKSALSSQMFGVRTDVFVMLSQCRDSQKQRSKKKRLKHLEGCSKTCRSMGRLSKPTQVSLVTQTFGSTFWNPQ